MAETLLSASHLHYSIAHRTLLQDVTLGIETGSRIGLIGDNGAGKSTLLRLLDGQLAADGGTITRRNPCRIGMLEQVPKLPDGTVFDALKEPFAEVAEAIERLATLAPGQAHDALVQTIERLGGWSWQHELERAAQLLGVTDLNQRCQDLSGGYRKRVALCRLMLQKPDVLFLDEPTNHLDTDTVLWLERFLAQTPTAAVIITHDRYFLDQVATQMAELRGGVLRTYRGNYSDYLVARAEEEALEGRTEARALRVLAHELDWASRSPQARTTKNRARLQRVEESRDALLNKTRAAALDTLRFGQGPRLGKSILTFDHVIAGHAPHKPLFEPLHLELCAQQRWGIIGPNGAGKTSLLTLITGALAPLSGAVIRGKNTQIAYFDQHRTGLDANKLVQDVLAPEGGDTVFFMGAPVHIRSWLSRFAFGPQALRMQVGQLSGGERNRLALAKLMLTEANLLILDEPTNDLDLLTLNVLEEALLHFAGCVIVVSHDRYFLDKVATHMLRLVPVGDGPCRIEVGVGGYTDIMAQSVDTRRPPPAAQAAAPAPRPKPAQPRKRSYKEEQELAAMEGRIEGQEARVAELEERLSEPSIWQQEQGEVGRRLTEELSAAQGEVRALYDRWQELLEIG
jgi:ATP-binding cassette subfamily F protein uup